MKVKLGGLLAWLLFAAVAGACGGGGSSGGASSTGGTSGSASGGAGTGAVGGSGGSASTGGSGGASGAAGGGGGGISVNGCELATAEDHAADANVDIHFPGASPPWSFTPRCIRVKKGTTVTFIPDQGVTFHDHGVYGGTQVDGTAPPDPKSPISPKDTSDSNPLVVSLPAAGNYGYYCPFHGYLGETGALFVE